MIVLMPNYEKHPRPYWHVDAKWVAGILLFFSLSSLLVLLNLSNITSRDQAVPATASIVANLFSKNGLDDPGGVAEFKQQTALLPDGATITPLTGFPSVHLTKDQVENLSPADLRVAIFSQLTGAIYDNGLKNAAMQLTNDPKAAQTFTDQAAPLGLLSKQNHEALQKASLIAAAISLVWLVMLVYFSAGWGRLVSPAVVLLAIGPVGTLLGVALLALSQSDTTFGGVVPSSILKVLSNSLQHTYGAALFVALGLLVVASAGRIIQAIIERTARKRPAFLKD